MRVANTVELKNKTNEPLREVMKGNPLIITYRGKPAAFKGLVWRRIELTLEDPLLLERQTMVKEALKTLNNSERRCFADRHATIVYDKGSYYLVIDPKIYAEYVQYYGTECKSCDGGKKKSTKISGKGR
jgi:hypothetical protein